jgi:succinoglycan biosynthesis transport protein ExoP
MEEKTQKSSIDYKDYVEEFDLQRYWLVLKRRWLPASVVFLAILAAAIYKGATQDAVYQTSGKLLFQVDRSTTLTGFGAELGQLESLNQFGGDPLATQAEILTSTPVLQQAISELNLVNEEGQPYSPIALKNSLEITQAETADTMVLSYASDKPQEAAAVVNQVMENYVEFNVEMNRAEATAAREFVERQLPRAEAEVEQTAEALRRFKSQNELYNLDAETVATVDAVNLLNDQISQARASLADANTQVAELRRQLGMPLEEALTVDELSQAPGIQQALTELQTIQTQLASERTRYTDNHPTVQNLAQQETALRSLVNRRASEVLGQPVSVSSDQLQMTDLGRQLTGQLAQAEVNRLSLVSQINELTQTRDSYINRSQEFPRLEKEQLELQQKLTAAQTSYDTLLQRFQEAQLAENQQVGSAKIIEAALVPQEPASGGMAPFVAAGVVGGGLMAVAAAFLLDLVDKSVKTVKDAESLLGYTLLGLIPKFSGGVDDFGDRSNALNSGISPRVVTLGNGYPFISGAYQMLQANLKFMSSDHPLKSLVLSSSIAKEGKSEVCANLAATMAQAGKRVLLVDADLRAPSQHHIWNVLNNVGLTHVLVGEGQLQDALKPVANNLTLLPAGVIPPNPLALLDSERMASLVNQFSQDYDYVIFDTPPLVGAADAAVLGKLASGILLVVRPRMVDSASVMAAKSLLSRSGANVLGFIANGVNIRNEHDDYVSMTRTRLYGYSDKKLEKVG